MPVIVVLSRSFNDHTFFKGEEMEKEFREIRVGERFFYNGNEYEKRSTRTAYLIEYGRVFYFGQRDRCRLNKR